MTSIENLSDSQLIVEMCERGLLTNAKYHKEMLNEIIKQNRKFSIILTYGEPQHMQECSRCRATKNADEFRFYQARVSSDGFLQRSNALCKQCNNDGKKELDKALQLNKKNFTKPKKGDVCSYCQRKWEGKWHRHHQGTQVFGYICGLCNMSFSDHRNKDVKK